MSSDYSECGHQWDPKPDDPETITDDDHRCCCGANTWETP